MNNNTNCFINFVSTMDEVLRLRSIAWLNGCETSVEPTILGCYRVHIYADSIETMGKIHDTFFGRI